MLNGRVLVLNQSYEPLSICTPKRALTLIFLFKAELIESVQNRLVHSVNQSFEYPSVIKLCRYQRIPYRQVELSKKNVFRRDGGKCQYCGNSNKLLTIDHIMPKSRGGEDSWENLTTACFDCNNKKGNKTPSEAKMTLLSQPQKPNYVLYLNQKIGKVQSEWEQFLFC